MNSSSMSLSVNNETESRPSLTVITTPHVTRLTSVAKETVKSDVLDAAPLIERYDNAISEYVGAIDRRDLVMGSWKGVKSERKPTAQHITKEGDRARRVETSAFWDALETIGQRLDYVIENNDREAEKRASSARTREEWVELEREYIGYPPTVYEEEEEPTYCAAWDCHNIISLRGKRPSKYCCESCRKEQKAAELRLRKTGTYLPVKAYESTRNAYGDTAYALRTVRISTAASVGTDGKDYRRPVRRELSVSEMTQMEMKRAESLHGEVMTYNLADVNYYIDEHGRYHITGHKQAA